MSAREREVVYYARGGGISRMGPFVDEVEAWQAIMVRSRTGSLEPIDGGAVWPERFRRAVKP